MMKLNAIALLVISLFSFPAAALETNPILRAIPESTWLEIPNSIFQVGATDFSGLGSDILDYSGTYYDPSHRRVIAYGGGHAAYYGNEIVAFYPDSLVWHKDYDPDTCAEYSKTGPAPGLLPNGRPWTGHSYRHLTYIEHADRLFYYISSCGMFTPGCGIDLVFANLTMVYDYSAKTWSNRAPSGTRPQGNSAGSVHGAASYDPLTQLVYFVEDNGYTYTYNYGANTWTRLTGAGDCGAGLEPSMALMTSERKLVKFGASYSTSVYDKTYVFDIPGGAWTLANPVNHPSGRSNPGMTYDTLHHTVVLYGSIGDAEVSDGQVWTYNLAQNNWSSFTAANTPSGKHGSLHYDPVNNVFLSIQRSSVNALKIHALKINDAGFVGTNLDRAPKNAAMMSLSAFPNPFSSTVSFSHSNGLSGSMEIFNAAGRKVVTLSEKEKQWNAMALPAGVYLARASANGKTIQQMLFKMR